jgi:hypothetical protein
MDAYIKNLSKQTILYILAFAVAVTLVNADTLVLKNGKVLQGTYKGGSETEVVFEVNGELQTIPLIDISNITFSPRKAETMPESSPAAYGMVTIPEKQ